MPLGSKTINKAITRPETNPPSEAKISKATAGKAEPIMGEATAVPSHNSIKNTVPKIAPVVLP